MYKIANHFVDEAGVYFVRVVISDTEAQFFTFDHYPTQEEVDEVAQRYVEAKDASTRQEQPTGA